MALVTFDGHIGAGGPLMGRRISVMHSLHYVDRLILPPIVGSIAPEREKSFSQRFWKVVERAVSGLALGNSAGDPYFATPETALLPLTWDESPHAPKSAVGHAASPADLLGGARAVVVERAGAVEFRDVPEVLKVGLFSSWDQRVRRVMKQEGLVNADAAAELIAVRERAQKRYFKARHGADPEDPSLYDVVIDTSRQSIEMAVLSVSRRLRALGHTPVHAV